MKTAVLNIVRMPLADVNHPHPKNPRDIPPDDSEEIRVLDASLAHDYFDPVVWNRRNGLLVSGHVRVPRLLALGFTHADVSVVDYDDATHEARLLAGNDHSGKNNDDKLDALLTSLRTSAVDPVLALLSALPPVAPLPAGDADAEPQIDRAEELNKIWQVKPGDVWQIGPHRLMCGDSTSAEDLAKLMCGEKADLCFTSPPYGQQRDYTKESDCSNWDKLMNGVFANLPMSEAGQVLVNLGLIHRDCEWIPYWDKWIEWMRAQGWRRFGWYVWDQGHGMRGDYGGRCNPSFEFVFHFNRIAISANKWIECSHAGKKGGENRGVDGVVPKWSGDLIQSHKVPDSTWRIERQKGGIKGHPAPFSVALVQHCFRTWNGQLCYEPFLGSGTTMLAAQNLHRICYGMEISPGYCAVILDRMQRAFPDLEIQRLPPPP